MLGDNKLILKLLMLNRIKHNSNGKQKRLQELVWSIRSKLEELGNESHGSRLLIQKIDNLNTNQTPATQSQNIQSKYEKTLCSALAEATDPSISNIVRNIRVCLKDLNWREDRSEFYPTGSNLGKRYIESNLHTQLIGPSGCVAKSTEFMLGVFALGPWTLYKDHSHIAPELYLNLSNESDWRFDFGTWQRFGAGSLIWNPSNQVHATLVSERPFLSIFAWLDHVNCLCEVHHSKDHKQIEKQLFQSFEMSEGQKS